MKAGGVVRGLWVAGAALAALAWAAPASAWTLELARQAVTTGLQVKLGEVARLSGEPDEAGKVRAAGAVALGQAPRPGQVRVFTRQQIALRLRQAGLAPEAVAFAGSGSVAVRRPGRPVGREEAERLYRDEVARLLGVASERVALSLVNWVEPVVAEGEVSLSVLGEVAQTARAVKTGTLTGPVDLRVNGEPEVTLRPRAVVTVRVPAVVTREGIARGSVVQPGQVEVVECELSRLPEGALREVAQADGRQAVRALPAGTPLQQSDLMVPVVVHRGDKVTVTLETGALTLTVQGLALEEGGAGEVIKVQSLQSNRPVAGVVQGPGAVLVIPDGGSAAGL